jgi:nucleoside phosphorylase
MQGVAGPWGGEVTDVIILTALDLEQRAVVSALGQLVHGRWSGGNVYRAEIGPYRVVLPPPMGSGNTAAGVAAVQAIDAWRPQRLMLVGIAAGDPDQPDVRLGDVLVPDKVVGYETGKKTTAGFLPDPDSYRPSFDLLNAARAVAASDWVDLITTPRPAERHRSPVVHIGTMLTGEKVLADGHTLRSLRRSWRNTIGAEMESLGIATAAYRGGPGFLVVKAVCDHADGRKADNWQPYAAEAAARFAVAVLRREPFRPAPSTARPAVRRRLSYDGEIKLRVCERLVDDWPRLADYFGIQPHEVARLVRGREPQGVWEWLQAREMLPALPVALVALGRSDLWHLFDRSAE